MTIMRDSEAHMWEYWKEKKGYLEALLSQYPILSAKDPVIAYSVAQIESARMAIDRRMQILKEKEEDGE